MTITWRRRFFAAVKAIRSVDICAEKVVIDGHARDGREVGNQIERARAAFTQRVLRVIADDVIVNEQDVRAAVREKAAEMPRLIRRKILPVQTNNTLVISLCRPCVFVFL